MAVEDPGMFTVVCDECGVEDEMEPTAYPGVIKRTIKTWGIDDKTLEENGWKRLDSRILCPECKDEAEEVEVEEE